MDQHEPAGDGLVLVTGGTGHLGAPLVERLLARGRRVRVFTRHPGADPRVQWAAGDLATGAGLHEALAGVGTVVHAATCSPINQRGAIRPIDLVRSPGAVDVQGTAALLEHCRRRPLRQFLFVSIVGLGPRAGLPYNRVKFAAECLVRQSDLPWAIVPAAPFYALLARLFASLRRMPWWLLPDAVMQPVDAREVADYLAQCVDDGQSGMRDEVGGPQALPLPQLARDYIAARGLRRRVIPLPVPAGLAVRMGLREARGRTGIVTWQDWLVQQSQPGFSG